MAAYGLAVFTGAFLLFQVQPVIGKYILPWFGGAPGVWTTCLLFFQVLLLAGYAYAHLSARLLKLRAQVLLHLLLLGAALATLPITPGDSWKPSPAADPTLRIIALLAASLGLPYFVLSATAPLLQHWFSRTEPGLSPYRLYALSNAGSLLALLSYPTLCETWLTRAAQATLWGAGLGLYAAGCSWCGLRVWTAHAARKPADLAGPAGSRPSAGQRVLWLLLPACASVLLLAITNKICQDVAVVAFLWVLPLAVYLLSFIICFDRPQWYGRLGFGLALLAILTAMALMLADRLPLSVPLQILVYTAGLFVCCMVCHGEVCRLKPDPLYLTSFYLMLAAGGALGGLFVAVIAPIIFADYFELQWGLVLCGVLFLAVWAREQKAGLRMASPSSSSSKADEESGARMGVSRAWCGGSWPTVAWAACGLALAGLAVVLWGGAQRFARVRACRARNFYGVLKVYRHELPDPTLSQVELMHGRIAHGMQFLHPSRARWPTLYFGPTSGIGRTLGTLRPGGRRVGVVGLGAGTLAAYAQRGDRFRFYEINPEAVKVARTYFSYLRDAPGDITVALGDARLSLETEPPQDFDLLVLDAFNSDSIPIHLLTREAFGIYQRHLKPNGLIAVHVSNMSLNLEPVVSQAARCFGWRAVVIDQPESNYALGLLPSTWVVLSRSPDFANAPAIREAARPVAAAAFKVPLWTDDFSSLFPILRWQNLFGIGAGRAKKYVPASALLAQGGGSALALARCREALRQEPGSVAALNNLACLLATTPDPALRDGAEAVKLAERACALTAYRNTVMVTTLAAAYAEAGRFEEAIATAQKACALAARNGETVLLARNRQLLEFYRRHEPYHQPAPSP